jgi:hypothetical protein
MAERKPRLLRALNALYGRPDGLRYQGGASDVVQEFSPAHESGPSAAVAGAHVPWLSGPEDSWL